MKYWKRLYEAFFVILLCGFAGTLYYIAFCTDFPKGVESPKTPKGMESIRSQAYAEGVVDALDTYILLGLEQDMQGIRRRNGEMCLIVAERLKIDAPEHVKRWRDSLAQVVKGK